jgi:hypothetical protein
MRQYLVTSAYCQSLLSAGLVAFMVGGCATQDGYGPIGGSQATHQAATGAAIGAVAGNVLGYMTDSDRTTATLLGALVGGGIGYWRGLEADRRLQSAQATAQEVTQVQQSQSQYNYEQPKLYARETTEGGKKVATLDKLETPIPYDAVRNHSQDASSVLRRLGALAAKNNADVAVYAPTKEARDYMIAELRKGAGSTRLAIDSSYSKDTKVVVDQAPSS